MPAAASEKTAQPLAAAPPVLLRVAMSHVHDDYSIIDSKLIKALSGLFIE